MRFIKNVFEKLRIYNKLNFITQKHHQTQNTINSNNTPKIMKVYYVQIFHKKKKNCLQTIHCNNRLLILYVCVCVLCGRIS